MLGGEAIEITTTEACASQQYDSQRHASARLQLRAQCPDTTVLVDSSLHDTLYPVPGMCAPRKVVTLLTTRRCRVGCWFSRRSVNRRRSFHHHEAPFPGHGLHVSVDVYPWVAFAYLVSHALCAVGAAFASLVAQKKHLLFICGKYRGFHEPRFPV